MVEPIFELSSLQVTAGHPSVFQLQSTGSGKAVRVHFCPSCGTKLYLTFDRFPSACGIYAGTYDDPNWFRIEPETAKHIFVSAARSESLLPATIPIFAEHAMTNDGTPQKPIVMGNPALPADCLMLDRH